MKKYLLNSMIIILIVTAISCSSENSKVKETTTEENVKPIEKKKDVWNIVKKVDEFGDEVKGGGAIIGIFDGKMSNSVTTNAHVKVKIQVEKNKESYITFYEYGNSLGNLPDNKLFKIKIKKEDGTTEFIKQFSMKNMLIDTKGVLIGKVLNQKSSLKINVDLSRSSRHLKTVYNFEINPSGLKQVLEQIK